MEAESESTQQNEPSDNHHNGKSKRSKKSPGRRGYEGHKKHTQDDAPMDVDEVIPKVQVFVCKDSDLVAVLMEPSAKMGFIGQMDVKVVKGAATLLGHRLTAEWCSAFVPKSGSLLSISASVVDAEEETDYTARIQEHIPNKLFQEVKEHIQSDTCMLVCRRCDNNATHYISAFYPFLFDIEKINLTGLCAQTTQVLPCYFYGQKDQLPPGSRPFREIEEWKSISASLQQHYCNSERTAVIVCGAKGVGKSTLIRYLVNRMLSESTKQVLLLDGDPGQSMCTVPGGMSLTLLEEPVLGPSFCQIRPHLRKIGHGLISMNAEPKVYVKGLKEVLAYIEKDEALRKLPVFVNTMGWTTGMGLDLLCDVIRCTRPSHIVQINSSNTRVKNLEPMTPSSVMNHDGVCYDEDAEETDLEYQLVQLMSGTGGSRGDNAPLNREISLVAYLSKLEVSRGVAPTPINKFKPYRVPWDALALCVYPRLKTQADVLHCMIGRLVVLLRLPDDTLAGAEQDNPKLPKIVRELPVAPSYGHGFLRGVNFQEKLLYVVCPESSDTINNVNCLLLGHINLPDKLFMSQVHSGDEMPYVMMYEAKTKNTKLHSASKGRMPKPRGNEEKNGS